VYVYWELVFILLLQHSLLYNIYLLCLRTVLQSNHNQFRQVHIAFCCNVGKIEALTHLCAKSSFHLPQSYRFIANLRISATSVLLRTHLSTFNKCQTFFRYEFTAISLSDLYRYTAHNRMAATVSGAYLLHLLIPI
jgi:hypothetical protein